MIPNGDLSFQLYSSRMSSSLDEQLHLLADLGYTDVQPYFTAPLASADELRSSATLVRDCGLSAKSGHFPLGAFATPDRVADVARAFGMKWVVLPWIDTSDRPDNTSGWQRLGRRLQGFADEMETRGLTFAWHNHDFEFKPLPDGTFPIEHLLGERLMFEPDLAWIALAGQDPVAWLERYRGRVPVVHVKDLAQPGTGADEMGFADVGHGRLDWPSLWDAAVSAGADLMVAEHDQPTDWTRFARRAIDSMRKLGSSH